MKSKLLCLPLFFTIYSAQAQQVVYSSTIAHNNVKAYISNNGTFFRNYTNQTGGYIVPKNTNISAIYMMNMAMSGTDINGQLKAAHSDYNFSDFQPGPIADDYADSTYQLTFGTSLWIMSRQEIADHIAQWNQQGYVPTANILQWPANGNTANGEAAQLAPYFDANANGIYEPMMGDYPVIRGDYAAYSIVNDDKLHPSGADPIGMEMHLMLYQYADSNEAINNTTFVHARLINRSTQTLYNFHVGNFIDYDLGNFSDDYVGCNPSRNLSYCYNGDLNDEANAGNPGYGALPPAIGVRYLNQQLNSHFVFSNNGVNNPSPGSPTQMEHFFNGFDQNGVAFTDQNGQQTPFMFNDISANGWNELNPVQNAPGDRRTIISTTAITLLPFSEHCYDFATVFSPNPDSTIQDAVAHLQAVSDEVQDFYDAQNYSCDEFLLEAGELTVPLVTVYPNPATTVLHLEGNSGIPFHLLSADGKIVFSGTGMESEVNLEKLNAGYYLFVNEMGSTVSFVKH